ncbi:MAG: carboxypeptidase regulatory-like domain-containing protein [Terriglobia bacterium]
MAKSRSKFHLDLINFIAAGALLIFVFSVPASFMAQTTISTGSIQGTITDASGAVIPGARITVSSKATGQTWHLATTSKGAWSSGALLPGTYTVSATAKGFKTTTTSIPVNVGVTSSGNLQLQVGATTSEITVAASAVQINTEQATIQDTVTREQIQNLPINGRNFLDLATLSPGVQIQDGGTFDPTKNGFSSISFGGRFGRTARIEVDGIDVSDEMVGTTTQNIPMSGIQQFQIEQSSLDLSTELTSSGAVNVTTRSGSNQFHGDAFLLAQDHSTAARYGQTDVPWNRQQYGADFGGPILHSKLFFFADWERTVQNLTNAVLFPAPFSALSGSYKSPFHESLLDGRLDWNINSNIRAFYRFSFDQNDDVIASAPNSYSPFRNRDHTPVEAAGLDFTTGTWTHSIRFGYTRFNNGIVDASQGVPNPAPGVEINAIGPFTSGPNLLAPQVTIQHNLQFKYDGSKIKGSHIVRYGAGINRIIDGGFAAFFGLAPDVSSGTDPASLAFAASGPFPGGISNPLNYPVAGLILGNGEGFGSAIPGLGYPAGLNFDTRFEAYVGDSWKIRPNLNVNFGLRYVRDTGRDDNNLPPVPALNQFAPGLGDRTTQPNLNFAPTMGIAWAPRGSKSTVIRIGGGLYYENAIFNNVEFDAPARLQQGLFFGTATACPSGLVPLPGGGTLNTSNICGQAIGSVVSQMIAAQQAFQAATVKAGPQANGGFVGTTLAEGADSTGNQLIAPDYKTPYSWQFNAGLQHQFGTGTVLSVDYVRNLALDLLVGYDTNHVGDARYLNKAAALNAINVTNEGFGCPDGPTGVQCAIGAGASIVDYANNGLDSGVGYLSGFPASAFGLTPATGAAFPGINPNLGQNQMLFPIGRSVYNALQVSLRQNISTPFRGVKQMSLQVSYALSRFDSFAQDQDFINNAVDFNNIDHYYGPNALDRTHQLSFGGVFDFPHNFRASFISHVDTALPLTLTLAAAGAPGEIFRTDVTGDGTTGDVLPGTNVGSFGRSITAGNLNNVVAAYNTNDAGKLTPAGQALVNAGLFTTGQLQALQAVMPSVQSAPAGEVNLAPFLDTDLKISYLFHPHRLWGRISDTAEIEPSVGIYNLFNFANYDAPGNTLSGVLNGLAGSVNGTTPDLRTNRTLFGSGVFAFGGPRSLEWGLRLSF